MKRILILTNSDVGLYKFRKELIENFIRQGYEVVISLPYGDFIKELQEMGCVFYQTNFERRGMNPICDLKLCCTYFKLLKKFTPSIVLTYTIKPNIYGGIVCRIKKIPYIVNITGLGTAIENQGIISKVLLKLYKASLKKSQCVFFQNARNKNYFETKRIFFGNSKLIPGSGVNLQEFCFETYPSEREKTKFLFIGRIMKDKGIEEFLCCAEEIFKENKNVEFGIIGDYDDKKYEEVISGLENRGIVTYYGMQQDVRPFIKDSNAIILPSYHEGLSNVLLEAAAMGRPVIASDIFGCKETFCENITGIGFKVKDSKALLNAVRKFLNLSWKEQAIMGSKARKKIEAEFDRNIIINAYNNEINRKEVEK